MEAVGVRRSGWVTLVGVLFVIGAVFELIWALVAVGVSLGGADVTVIGDFSQHNLEGVGIVGLIFGAIELYVGYAILSRLPSGQVLGIVIAALGVLLHFAYIRVLDSWGFIELVWGLAIILILTLRSEEFVVRTR